MKKQFRYITSLNLNASNFFDGVGSIVNLAGNSPRYDFLLSGSQADLIALKNDFNIVGQDIYNALDKIKVSAGSESKGRK